MQAGNNKPMKGEQELGYVAAMVNDFINTLPPSTRATVSANAEAAIQNLGKLLQQLPADGDNDKGDV